MPTGYTARLYSGEQGFAEFVADCAEAFNAKLVVEDDGSLQTQAGRSDPVYENMLKEAESNLSSFLDMSAEQLEERAASEYDAECKFYEEIVEKVTDLRNRYQSMLDQVEAWQCPDGLSEFKQFIIGQLEKSIDSDCYDPTEPKNPLEDARTFGEWVRSKLSRLESDVKYARKSVEDHNKRVESGRVWLEELVNSLNDHIRNTTPV